MWHGIMLCQLRQPHGTPGGRHKSLGPPNLRTWWDLSAGEGCRDTVKSSKVEKPSQPGGTKGRWWNPIVVRATELDSPWSLEPPWSPQNRVGTEAARLTCRSLKGMTDLPWHINCHHGKVCPISTRPLSLSQCQTCRSAIQPGRTARLHKPQL